MFTISRPFNKVLLAAVAIIAALPASARDNVLIVQSFGGTYEAAHKKVAIEPFARLHGIEVQVVTIYSGPALAQMRAQKDNPQFDVVHFSAGLETAAAAEGLLEPIQPEDLSNFADLYPIATARMGEGRGPAFQATPIGILYNSDKVPTPPTSWKDLVKPEYAGHIAMADIVNGGYPLISFLALNHGFGGSLDDIQPGLNAVKSMLQGGSLVVENSSAIEQNFAQNDVWLAPYASEYAYTMRNAGLPVELALPEEGYPVAFVTANIVAGRPDWNTEWAKKFIDFQLSPEVQAAFAEEMRFSPVNAKTTVPADVEKDILILSDPEQSARVFEIDNNKVAEHRQGWFDAWNRLISQ